MTKVRFAKALGTLLLLFAGTYGPAFLTVALLKLRPFEAVPVIIVISLAVAILLIKVVSGRAGGFAQFGFRFCHNRYIAAAIAFGVPIAWALTILVNRVSLPEKFGKPVKQNTCGNKLAFSSDCRCVTVSATMKAEPTRLQQLC